MVTVIPVTWDLNAVAGLDFKKAYPKDLEIIDRYIRSGHEVNKMIIYNYWEPNPMPAGIADIKQFFPELSCVTLAVHRTPPSCYLPLHSDLHSRYRETFQIGQERCIVRVIVMLAHSVPGQIIQIDQQTHGEWQPGQIFCWQNQTQHAIYNFSMQDRFAVQITGVLL